VFNSLTSCPSATCLDQWSCDY